MDLLPELALGNVTDLLLDAICIVDRQGNFLYVSSAGERIFGYRPEEMIGRNMFDFIHPGDHDRTRNAVTEIMAGQPKPHFENRYVRKDGSTVHIMWSARWSEPHQFRIAVARDITQRKQAEYRQAAIYAIADAANILGDLDRLFGRIHRVVDDLLGASDFIVAVCHTATGRLDFPYRARPECCTPETRARLSRLLTERVIRRGESLLLGAGELQEAEGNGLAAPIKSQEGVIGALLVLSPAGHLPYGEQDRELLQFVAAQLATAMERKRMLLRLEHMARYDPLTDLPNRTLFMDRLQTALKRAHREQGRLALLYLDLDKFKQVNDRYGHLAGDRLLQEVAVRLSGCVRESDTVARLGGDEFVVLLEDVAHPAAVEQVADKIHRALAAGYHLPEAVLHIRPSLGVALYPDHGGSEQELMAHADGAMYRTKKGTAAGSRPAAGN
ncbi:diguanylate cyclase domain-containing protein [Zobellella sp. An-6]|uniref:diguanylate cyclase domain-containing protein n=1 Tax=Zobellella sp. An-6 TaxID=3400218 RepID=UPI004042B7B9